MRIDWGKADLIMSWGGAPNCPGDSPSPHPAGAEHQHSGGRVTALSDPPKPCTWTGERAQWADALRLERMLGENALPAARAALLARGLARDDDQVIHWQGVCRKIGRLSCGDHSPYLHSTSPQRLETAYTGRHGTGPPMAATTYASSGTVTAIWARFQIGRVSLTATAAWLLIVQNR